MFLVALLCLTPATSVLDRSVIANTIITVRKLSDSPLQFRESPFPTGASPSKRLNWRTIPVPALLKKAWLYQVWQDPSGRFALAHFDGPTALTILDLQTRRAVVTLLGEDLYGRPLFLDSAKDVVITTGTLDGTVRGKRISLRTGQVRLQFTRFDLAFEDRQSGAVALVRRSRQKNGPAMTIEWIGGKPGDRGKQIELSLQRRFGASNLPTVVRDLRPGVFLLGEKQVDDIGNGPAVMRSSVADGLYLFYHFEGEGWALEFVTERPDGQIVMRGLNGTIVGTTTDGPRQVFYLFNPVTGAINMSGHDLGEVNQTILRW